jgi:hypothetical protein
VLSLAQQTALIPWRIVLLLLILLLQLLRLLLLWLLLLRLLLLRLLPLLLHLVIRWVNAVEWKGSGSPLLLQTYPQ